MSDRLQRGLPGAATLVASAPDRRAWVIVHPVAKDGATRYRARFIELDAALALTDVDLDATSLARDESRVLASLDDVARELERHGTSLAALGDPRDCACPV